ncbi:hypothetical protein EST38_g4277 [Candolleomyces aberdarensis]|uniref:Uncharacterized protein n=1 Tax=Candolleomyces aberdarensis TaxID=2316362 RepID=A0A4Q2DNI3_9AGAR|nr:hypothetical protein EST38_g4277 [Candolleomyces aberdarensis]
MVIACLVIGSTHRTAVLGPFVGGSYCFLGVPAPAKISAITVAVLLLPTIALEVSIGRMLHKNWLVLRHQNHFPLNTVIRILVFTAVGILVIGLGVVFAIMQLPDPRLNIIIAIAPKAPQLPDFHEVPVYDGSSNIKPPTLLSGPPQTWTIRPERKTPPSDF